MCKLDFVLRSASTVQYSLQWAGGGGGFRKGKDTLWPDFKADTLYLYAFLKPMLPQDTGSVGIQV
jgi:hypothetical protein